VVDCEGVIIDVSESWTTMGDSLGAIGAARIGRSYYSQAGLSSSVADQLQDVFDGKRKAAVFLLPRHAAGARDFVVLGCRLPASDAAILYHLDVTTLIASTRGRTTGSSAVPDRKTADHDNDVIASLLHMTVAELFEGSHHVDRWSQLSTREAEVAELVALGQTNAGIASTLGCSVNTVKRHITSILKKIRATERTQITTWLNAHERALD
jgi:DNA-binding CsgD family transcriptional regulator